MKQTALFFLLVLTFSLFSQPKKMLFLGNSYTAVNNLPLTLYNFALAAGDTIIYDSNTPGGYTFQGHSTNATSLAKINSQAWDYVVLQEQSQMPSFPPAQVATDVFPYATLLDSLIHNNNACSQTVFYMTWGRKYGDASNCANYPPLCTYDGMTGRLRDSYLQMGDMNEALVAPVGMAWKASRTADSTINLWSADNSHPSVAGTYLTTCVFYATIFEKTPVGNSFISTLPAATATFLQNIAHQVVFDSLSTWNIDVFNPQAAFVASQNGYEAIFTNNAQYSNAATWDFGDGTTNSTTLNPSHIYATPGTYNVSQIVTNGCNLFDTLTQSITIHAPVLSWQRANTFGRGMNLPYLEEYWGGDSAINYTNYLDLSLLQGFKDDISLMAQMNMQTLRLPVCFSAWENGVAPYDIDSTKYFAAIDSFLVWTNAQNMKLIIDFHHGRLSSANAATEIPRIADIWRQVAQRYASTNPEKVFFEVYNEPWDVDSTTWRTAANAFVTAIRAQAPQHSIIVGGSDWNSISGLQSFYPLGDSNIIYTFHFYAPMIFTHQGATWAGNAAATQGIPFPYNAATMPVMNPLTAGTWGENAYNTYGTYGNVATLANAVGAAKNWSNVHQLPIYCGEWGSYKPFIPNDGSRCRYTEAVKAILDSLEVPFTYWEWNEGFSLFDGVPAINNLSQCMADIWGITIINVQEPIVSKVSIYPNPVADALHILVENAANTDMFILDMTGKQIFQGKYASEISVKDLPQGMYVLKVAGKSVLFVKE